MSKRRLATIYATLLLLALFPKAAVACKDRIYPASFPVETLSEYSHVYVVDMIKRLLFWAGGAVGFFVIALIVINVLSKLKRTRYFVKLKPYEINSWQSELLKILGYTMCTIAVLGTTLFSFIFLLFALKDTPLHNGEELPSFPLFSVSLVGALLVAAWVIVILRRRYKRDST